MTWTVRRLIDGGWCSTRCLTATASEATVCRCPCGGRWHALLSHHHVPPPTVGRPAVPSDQMALFDVPVESDDER